MYVYQSNVNVADTSEIAEIRPEDDFYGYTNFDFLWNNNIPGNMTEYSYATMVESETDKFLSEEIIRLGESEEKFSLGSDNQKIKDLYLQYLDTEDREKAEKLNEFFAMDYLFVWKDYAICRLLYDYSEYLPQKYTETFSTVNRSGDISLEEKAIRCVKKELSAELGKFLFLVQMVPTYLYCQKNPFL